MAIAVYARRQLQQALRGMPPLLEIFEVADLLNVHERTVRRWLNDGKLAGVDKGGRGYLIPKGALIDFMTGGEPEADA